MNNSLFIKILTVLLLLHPLTAAATGTENLKSFFQNTSVMKAKFHQTVIDRQGRKVQDVDGIMQLHRPGKFRWDYAAPYVQIIVGDGQKVWLFDPDLNQVTVRPMDKVLGSSPAALLAGNKGIEKAFLLQDDIRQDGLDWVKVTPKDKDAGFEGMYLGFRGEALAEMELHDNFGQVTVIEFTEVERNIKLSPKAFTFVPPLGADVVGE